MAPRIQKRPAAAAAAAAGGPSHRRPRGVVSSGANTSRRWLLKSEPADYSIDAMQKDGRTAWDGVRNAQARNNMKAMKPGDECLFYHSSCSAVGVVGVVAVVAPARPDPKDARWVEVEVAFRQRFRRLVSLAELKKHASGALKGLALFAQGRLSVQPLSAEQFDFILALAAKPAAE
eukprot:TRINITY_DN48456_c0_g1_i1.p2 TRINITY_DN48456_c0_g1~~TRINITY_DN48456_c0_g1_i1.p2  ORF type:complete len:176 (-),score=47.82 TRINITY_DN48456_c0_g1_i1:188-715(-)